jgi:predicted Zn-dependent protease
VKSRAVLGVLLVAGAMALLVVARRGASTEVTPRTLFYLLADTQRELERIPLAMTRVSDQEEMAIGAEMARSYGLTPARHESADARRVAEYVQSVGQRLAMQVKRKGIRYRIFYDESRSMVNAGALPGGHAVIGRGLLELIESEDELAAILGHEIAHVDERHAIERLQYELKSKSLGLRGLYRLAQLGVVLWQAGYSKEQEAEADRAGLALAVAAGYSPQGAVNVLRRFDLLYSRRRAPAASPVEEILAIPAQALGEYFRSHPPAHERLAIIEKEIAARGWDVSRPQKPMFIRGYFLADFAASLDARGLWDRAIVIYQKALELMPRLDRAWSGMARAHWRAGNAEATAQAAEQAVAIQPELAQAWEFLSRALGVSDHTHALARYHNLMNSHPPRSSSALDAAVQERYALACFTAERPEDALREFEAYAATHRPEVAAAARRRMAWWLYRAGRARQAEGQLERARQLLADEAATYRLRGWVKADLELFADAEASLARSESEGAEALALEALISWRTGRDKEAKESFRRAAEADPVWMNARWTANNWSAAAHADLLRLQQEELARRKAEALRAGRVAAPPAKPGPP